MDFNLLENLAKTKDDYYTEYFEPKYNKSGNPRMDIKGNPIVRTINPSLRELKKIQKTINSKIFSILNYPSCVFGGIKGGSTIAFAKQHKGKKFHFKTDLKDFYPSIKNSMVYSGLVSYGFSPDIASILTKLTTYKGKVPQGAPTSSYVANIAFIDVDIQLLEYCKTNEMLYTRYLDDLMFSSEKPLDMNVENVIKIINDNLFMISHKKTVKKTGPLEAVGIKIKNNNLTGTDKFKEKTKSREGFSDKQVKGFELYAKRLRKA